MGFFTDAYDIFGISLAATMIGYVYHQGGSNTANQDLGIKVAHSIGTFFGQLLFGFLADHVGRKKMYGVELMIIIGECGTLFRRVVFLWLTCIQSALSARLLPARLPPFLFTVSSSSGVS